LGSQSGQYGARFLAKGARAKVHFYALAAIKQLPAIQRGATNNVVIPTRQLRIGDDGHPIRLQALAAPDWQILRTAESPSVLACSLAERDPTQTAVSRIRMLPQGSGLDHLYPWQGLAYFI
jgi:hypothetical protein